MQGLSRQYLNNNQCGDPERKRKLPCLTIPASGRNEECPAIWNLKIHVVAEAYMGEELRVELNSASVVLHLSDIHKNYAEDYQWRRTKDVHNVKKSGT